MNQQFWTTLGQYMAPISNADGEKINWINYKTGAKHIRFVMQADSKTARIFIEISHKDEALQIEYFGKFTQLKKLLENRIGEQWNWQPNTIDEFGKTISLIYTSLQNVNVFDRADWPLIISFFKSRMIALDKFWCDNRFAFER